jgi:methylthioribose-1-phosphate isomerase
MVETKEEHLEGVQKIKKLIDTYNEVEQFFDDLPSALSKKDKQFSDIYHNIMKAKLTAGNSYRFCREIKKIANERAEIKKNIGIKDTFNIHKQKLDNNGNRGLLGNEIFKKEKSLDTQYKNRIYTDDDIKEMLGES